MYLPILLYIKDPTIDMHTEPKYKKNPRFWLISFLSSSSVMLYTSLKYGFAKLLKFPKAYPMYQELEAKKIPNKIAFCLYYTGI